MNEVDRNFNGPWNKKVQPNETVLNPPGSSQYDMIEWTPEGRQDDIVRDRISHIIYKTLDLKTGELNVKVNRVDLAVRAEGSDPNVDRLVVEHLFGKEMWWHRYTIVDSFDTIHPDFPADVLLNIPLDFDAMSMHEFSPTRKNHSKPAQDILDADSELETLFSNPKQDGWSKGGHRVISLGMVLSNDKDLSSIVTWDEWMANTSIPRISAYRYLVNVGYVVVATNLKYDQDTIAIDTHDAEIDYAKKQRDKDTITFPYGGRGKGNALETNYGNASAEGSDSYKYDDEGNPLEFSIEMNGSKEHKELLQQLKLAVDDFYATARQQVLKNAADPETASRVRTLADPKKGSNKRSYPNRYSTSNGTNNLDMVNYLLSKTDDKTLAKIDNFLKGIEDYYYDRDGRYFERLDSTPTEKILEMLGGEEAYNRELEAETEALKTLRATQRKLAKSSKVKDSSAINQEDVRKLMCAIITELENAAYEKNYHINVGISKYGKTKVIRADNSSVLTLPIFGGAVMFSYAQSADDDVSYRDEEAAESKGVRLKSEWMNIDWDTLGDSAVARLQRLFDPKTGKYKDLTLQDSTMKVYVRDWGAHIVVEFTPMYGLGAMMNKVDADYGEDIEDSLIVKLSRLTQHIL